MTRSKLPAASSPAEVERFLQEARRPGGPVAQPLGRLLIALDATASRQPSWDRACRLQADMFAQAASVGGLLVQLLWYRGIQDFGASSWHGEAAPLVAQMQRVQCAGGLTQIGRVLHHAQQATRSHRIRGLVFVGDCMEEDPALLIRLAGELGVLKVPVFLFQEGADPTASRTFAEIASLSGGAHCRFDQGSAAQLRELLGAVAVYAAGGARALAELGRREGGMARRLAHQLGER